MVSEASPALRSPTQSHRSWIWLGVGAVLFPFAPFQTVIPIAAWVAPIFLLRFARGHRARVAIPTLALVGYVGTLIATRGFLPVPAAYVMALAGLGAVIPYATDIWLTPRLGRRLRTLVFPATETALGFLAALGPFATMGMTAYSQGYNPALIQLAALTGVWGLQFVIAWTAPIVNDLWESGFDLRRSLPVYLPWVIIVAGLLLFGGARLALASPPSRTVLVAGLAPSRSTVEELESAAIAPGPRSTGERQSLHLRYFAPVIDDLFHQTRLAAESGAGIVVWSEAAAHVFAEDLPQLLDRAAIEARESAVYLQIGVVVLLPATERPNVEIWAILFDPEGRQLWVYPKATSPLGDGNRPGTGVMPVVETPYGRLSTVICFDADLPGRVRQAGRSGVAILLLPSSDFGTAGEMHARMSIMRAVENGMSLVRPTRRGVSLATDQYGRLLAYRDDYGSGAEQTLMVAVPTRGVTTVYPLLGDLVAWGSALTLVLLIVLALPGVKPRLRRAPDLIRGGSS